MSTTAPDVIPAGIYNVDPVHSNVGFEVRHMAIATVHGAFRKFEGKIDATHDLSGSGTVEVSSVDTGTQGRDDDLRSENFFDVAKFPQITFKTTGVKIDQRRKVTANGELTIKDVTKPVELTGEIGESAEDPWGHQRVGLTLSTTIDRREFNLTYNTKIPNGNWLVGNEIKLIVDVSAVKAD